MKKITTGIAAVIAIVFLSASFAHASEVSGTLSSSGSSNGASQSQQGTLPATVGGSGGSTSGNAGGPRTNGTSRGSDASEAGAGSGSISSGTSGNEGGVGGSEYFSVSEGSNDSAFGTGNGNSTPFGVNEALAAESTTGQPAAPENQLASVSGALIAGASSFWFWLAAILALIAASAVYGFIKYRQVTYIR